MTDYKALCAKLINELHGYKVANPMHDRFLLNRALLQELTDAVLSDDSHIDCAKIARRARAALVKPEPPADREVAGLVAWLHGQDGGIDRRATYSRIADLLSRLAPQPVPEGPSKAELRQLFLDHSGYIDDEPAMFWSDFYASARAILARWGRP